MKSDQNDKWMEHLEKIVTFLKHAKNPLFRPKVAHFRFWKTTKNGRIEKSYTKYE